MIAREDLTPLVVRHMAQHHPSQAVRHAAQEVMRHHHDFAVAVAKRSPKAEVQCLWGIFVSAMDALELSFSESDTDTEEVDQ